MPHEAIAMPEGGLFLLLIVHVPLRTDFSRAPHAPGIQARPFRFEGKEGNSSAKLLLYAGHLICVHVLSIP